MTKTPRIDKWFYPDELEIDLEPYGVQREKIAEIVTQSWELNRCIVPEFSNWDRYMALTRLGVIAYVADYIGRAIDVVDDGPWIGYDIEREFDILFGGSPIRDEMAREFRSAVLVMTEKSSERRSSTLYRRYADALSHSAADYFRLRDCDGMIRFYLNAAIACNDSDRWLTEDENAIIAEIAITLFDSISFYKHRAEGEICNLFAYADPELRATAYKACRETLWALDPHWSQTADRRCLINYCRYLGGPVHMLMRRYRYVEEGMTLGMPESEAIVDDARRNVKLWYRNDPVAETVSDQRYEAVMARPHLLFDGLADILDRPAAEKCHACERSESYGIGDVGKFSGVILCGQCRKNWGAYLEAFPDRARNILPLATPKLT
ncbi:hypothetical protein [Nocardia sp. NPDC019395]|uniref:hypothetical protein n=1 Tax=Nocardia sp. NPDC019395 TaxID=3154686 RepID=UPI0033D8D590